MITAALRILHKLEDAFLITLLLAALGLATSQIFLRNAGLEAITWADQAINILVLWIALAGALLASRERAHIAIDLASHYAGDTSQRIFSALRCLATAALCGIAAWYGTLFVIEERSYGDIAFLNVPVWVCEAVIPAALALISLRYSLFFLQAFIAPQTREVGK
jgi:TRAP-type C4-dicarboxylate transport system permease small subunit